MGLEQEMKIAGIGCRAGIEAGEVLAAIDAALAAHALDRASLGAVATVPQKAGERALSDAAQALGLTLVVADAEQLERVRQKIVTRSVASLAATGFDSAAEAAALAVAGNDGALLGPRIVLGNVTCAIAEGGR
jgi:cobalt-precorrin 5A hydrolase